MADQTIPPEEIILVRDGEVGEQLQCAIDEIVSSSPGMFTYIPLEKNGGLGNALKSESKSEERTDCQNG